MHQWMRSSSFEIGVQYHPPAFGRRSILNPNFSEFRWYSPIRPRQTHSILSLLSSFYMIHKVHGNVTRGRFSLLSSFYMIHKVQGNVTRGRFSLLSSFYMNHKVQREVTRGRFSLLSSFYIIHKMMPWSPKFAYFCNFRTFICVFNVSSGMSLLSVGLGGTGGSPITRFFGPQKNRVIGNPRYRRSF